MKSTYASPAPCSFVPWLLAGLAATAQLTAQTTPPPAADDDATVELSPFVVSVDKDDGYNSNETLSGTRLRTSVKDVASAMTIVTPELLADLGALNFNDVADFLPSTASYANNDGDQFDNGSRTGTPFIVRGFRSDSLSTNFFTTLTQIDSYNTSRFTFARGPNSILFSIGNPGGSLDVTTNRASLTASSGKLSARVDSHDSWRLTVDDSLILVPKKLGLRVDLLSEDRQRNIQPSRGRRDSAFLTGTWQATPTTTVTANFEANRLRLQLPRPYEYYDWYNTWFDAGQTIVPTAKSTTARPGVEYLDGNGYYLEVPGIGLMNWSKMGHGARPLVAGARDGQVSYGADTPNRIVPLDTYIVGDGDHVYYDTRIYSLFVQQKLARGLYLKVAGQYETARRENFESDGQDDAIKVDPNAQLPDGTANPHVGQPYVDASPRRVELDTSETQFRTTLSYEKDFRDTKLFGRGLGRFTLAGLYNNESNHQYLDAFRQVNVDATTALNLTRNYVRRRWYLVPGNTPYLRSDFALTDENGIKTEWAETSAPRDNFTRVESFSLAGQADLLDNLVVFTGGIRRDEALVAQHDFTADSRGVYVDGSHHGTPAADIVTVAHPFLFGVVANPARWFDVFFNRSTNFQPTNQSYHDINGVPLAPLQGRGIDTGVKLFLLDDKLTASFTYFETEQANVRDSAINNSPDQKDVWIEQIWNFVDPTKIPGDPSWTDVKTQKTHGIEIQLVANPTKNLRLSANASRDINQLQANGLSTFPYLAANYPVWEAYAAANPGPVGNAITGLIDSIRAEEADDHALVGIRQTRTYEWQVNMVGRYKLDDFMPPLKGFAVGAAWRWRDAPVIGFARTGTILDGTKPFYGESTSNLDLWVDYSRSFVVRGHRYRWSAQLRCQNVLDDESLVPWTAVDDGTGHAQIRHRRTPGDRSFAFTSSLTF